MTFITVDHLDQPNSFAVGSDNEWVPATCIVHFGKADGIGRDEFLLILEGVERQEETSQVAERVLECIKQPINVADTQVTMTGSLGIAVAPHDGRDFDTICKTILGTNVNAPIIVNCQVRLFEFCTKNTVFF